MKRLFSNWAGPFTEVPKDLLNICFKEQEENEGMCPGSRTLHCTAIPVSLLKCSTGEHKPGPGEVGSQAQTKLGCGLTLS